MKKIKITKIVLLVMIFTMACTVTAFADATAPAGGDVFAAGTNLINDIRSFLVKVSTAAAIIGIAVGAMMCKFAAGNQQKIEKGFMAIKWSIGSWTLVNGAMMIFATVQKYIS